MMNIEGYSPPEKTYNYPAWQGAPSSSKFLEEMRGFLEQRGIMSASYRNVRPFHSQLDVSAELHHFGFSASWIEFYDRHPEFRRLDPIADFIMAAGRFMTWNEAVAAQQLGEAQQSFVATMRANGLVDGIALPLYGPRGRAAYATYSFGRPIVTADLENILILNDFFIQRHVEIALADDNAWTLERALSNREKEVLFWIAKGKSNADISIILDLRHSTVCTFANRAFVKLGVNNRLDATRVALHRGIINLSDPDLYSVTQ